MARRPEPSLRRTLLRWLLGPLLALLLVDAAISWWSAQRAADLAHDRSLGELARELALHVEPTPAGLRLALTEGAERVLLRDDEDRIAYRITDAAGRALGGRADLPLPEAVPQAGQPGGRMQLAAASEDLLSALDRLTQAYQDSVEMLLG